MIKKLLLGVFFVLFTVVIVAANCNVYVDINVSTDPNAVTQEVWYDQDTGVANNEQMVCQGDMTMTSCDFQIPNPSASDEVWIITKNETGTETYESAHIPVGGLAGSTVITVITNCSE